MTVRGLRRPLLWGCAISLGFCVACGGDAGSTSNDSNAAQGGKDDPAGDGNDGAGDGSSTSDGTDGAGDGSNPGDGSDGAGDGSDGAGDGSDGTVMEGSTAYFRMDDMLLLKPGVYDALLQVTPLIGTVNDSLKDSLTKDELPQNAPDGNLDLSVLLRFKAFEPTANGEGALGGASCKAPLGSAPCEPDPSSPFTELPYVAHADGTCLEAENVSIAAPCFVNDPQDLTVMFAALGAVPLKGAQVAGTWDTTPADGIVRGLLRGFLTQSAADQTKVPKDIPLAALAAGITGGTAVSKLLRKQDQEEYDGELGWWFTVQFSAKPVSFSE